MKNFFAKKSWGFYCIAVAVVLDLLACILYGISRENNTGAIIILLVFAMVTGVIVAVKPFKYTEYVPFVLTAIPFGLITYILIENISQIFFKNNVIGISGTFITSFVLIILAMVACAVSLVVKHEKEDRTDRV